MIVKVKGGWVVMNKTGTKRLSRVYKDHADAVKRLREIETFKHHPAWGEHRN